MAKQLNKSIKGDKIDFQVNLNVDKTSLNDLQKSLSDLSRMTQSDILNLNKGMNLKEADAQLKEIRQTVTTVKQSLSNAFNKDLGTVNVTKFNNELSKSGISIKQLYSTFAAAGTQGKAAFRSLTSELMSTEMHLKKTHNIIQDMANTMANSIKWSIASSAINNFSGSVQKAYGYVKELDTSLNNIRIVTGKSADDMDRFAKQANKAAQALGAQTTTYTDAALIYYQQGLGEEDVKARTEATVKASNVTGMSGQDTSEALTAVWNGYKVQAEETELYVDKLAKVAAGTAADLEELSTGMSKVASAANTAGVDVDQLNGILATVISVTREAPETIGSAFKTIFARMGDLKLNGQDEFGVSLGNVSGQLHELGIEILDKKGEMRDMGDIIEDTAAKWDTWTRAQKQAAAVAMAGKMQYSRLMSLFENWDMYTDAVNMSKTSMGELQNQQDIYMESTQAHLDKMRASFEGLYDALLDPEAINGTTDAISLVVKQITNVVEGFNGGIGVLNVLGSTALRVFSQQIGGGIATAITNFKNMKDNAEQVGAQLQLIEQFKTAGIDDSTIKDVIDMKEALLDLNGVLNEEQQNQALVFIKAREEVEKEVDAINKAEEAAQKFFEERTNVDTSKVKDEKGKIDFSGLKSDENKNVALSNGLKDATKEINENKKAINELKNAYSDYYKANKRADKDQNKLTANYKILEQEMEKARNEMGKLADSKLADEKATDKLNQAITKYDQVLMDSDSNSEEAEEAGKALLQTYQEVVAALENEVEGVSTTLSNATEGLSDKTREKVEDIKKGFKNFKDEFDLKNQITQTVNFIGGLGQVASAINVIQGLGSIWGDDSISDGEKILKTIETLAMAIPLVITGFTAIKTSMGPALIPLVAGLKGMTVAEFEAATAGTSMWAAVLGPIALIIAGIAAVGLAIYGLVKAFNAEADAAKEARENARQMAEQAENAKQAYEDLVESFNKYDEAVEKLKDLTVGTEEYADTVREANEQVMELVKNNKSLAKHVVQKGNGVLGFDDEEDIKQKAKTYTDNASSRADIAQMMANEATLQSKMTDFRRDANLDLEQKAIQFGVLNGLNPTTMALNGLALNLQDSISNEQLEEIIKHYSDTGAITEDWLKQEMHLSEGETKAILDNIDSLNELKTATEELTATNKLLVGQSLKSSLEENKKFTGLSEGQKNAVTALYGEGMSEDDIKKLKKQAEDKWDNDFAFGWGNEDEVHKAYADLMDYEVTGDHWGDTADYYDPKTGEEIKKFSDDAARAALKAEYVRQEMANYDTNSLDSIIESIKKIDASALGAQYGGDFTEAMYNAISSTDKKFDMSALFKEWTPSEFLNLVDLSKEGNEQELLKAFGLTEEDLDALGYKSATDFAKSFRAGLEGYEWNIDDAIENAVTKNKDELDKNNIDQEEIKDYTKQLMAMADQDEKLADSLEEDAEAASHVAEYIMLMNDGIEDLAKNWDDWTDVLKKSSKTSEEYATAMGGIREALSKVIGVEEAAISNKFIEDHLDEIKKAANGDAEAIDNLRATLVDDMIADIIVHNGLDDATTQNIMDNYATLKEQMKGIDIGMTVKGDHEVIKTLQKIIDASGMTQKQANQFLQGIGFKAKFKKEKKKMTQQIPGEYTITPKIAWSKENATLFGQKMPFKLPTITADVKAKTKKVEGDMDVASMTTDGSTPIIESLERVGGSGSGSYNNYSSSNSGGPSPSGGGGGGGKSSEPSKKDLNEDKVDRYEKVNVQLDLISARLKKLQSQEDKLLGQKLINNLNKQLQSLNDEIDKTNEKLKIAHEEQAEYQRDLASYGVQFDAQGVMTNYAQVFAAQQAALNGVYNHYNSLSAEAQKGYEDAVKAAEKKWNKFKETVSNYDKLTGSTIPGLEQSIQDAIDKQIDIKVKEFDMEIELALDIKDAQDKWNEFKKKIIKDLKDDDILGNALDSLERFADYYDAAGKGVLQEETKYLQDLMAEIDKYNTSGWSDWYGDNETKMMEDLKKYYEQAFDDLQNVKALVDEIHDALDATLQDVAERMDEQMNYYEAISDTLEHDMKMVELVYGDEAFGRLELYYSEQEKNYNNQLEFQRAQVDFWKQQMDALDKGSTEWETARDNWLDAVNEWQSMVESAIENLTDKYLNTINKIFQELNNQVTKGAGMDFINAEWELIQKHADEYLDTINSTYGIQQLQNKYLDAMNDTDNLAYQRKLNELMKAEVADLKARDRLTQYDLDRAELKYQIALKQIALQEAQQNKSTMRLKRDTQGNYTYQYVSDDDEVKKVQEEISDLYNQLYNLDVDRYTGNLDQLYEIWMEYQEKMAEAAAINDPEARLQKEQLLTQQYGDLINGIVDQNEQIKRNLYESTFLELEDLYGKQAEIVQDFLDNQDDAMSLLVNGWASGLQEMADQIYAEGGFEPTYEQALADITEATADYEESLKQLQDSAKVTFETLGEDVDEVETEVQQLINKTDELISTFGNEVEQIKNVIGQIDELNNHYQQQTKVINTAIDAYNKYIQKMKEAEQAANKNTSSNGGSGQPTGGASGNGSSGGGGGNANRMPSVGQWATYNGGYYYGDSYGGGGRGSRGPGKRVKVTIVKNDGRPYPIHVESSDSAYGWLRKDQLSGYDTGGYTGSWGSTEGRVALLHEKELVLNKEDTKNLLDTVEVMRNLTNSLGSSILKQMASMSRTGINGMVGGEVVEQDVHIDAQFPNVRDSREIENALNNLVNAAAQRANKR